MSTLKPMDFEVADSFRHMPSPIAKGDLILLLAQISRKWALGFEPRDYASKIHPPDRPYKQEKSLFDGKISLLTEPGLPFDVRYDVFFPGARTPVHYHLVSAECIFYLGRAKAVLHNEVRPQEGVQWEPTDRQLYNVRRGSLVSIGQGVFHGTINPNPKESMELILVSFPELGKDYHIVHDWKGTVSAE